LRDTRDFYASIKDEIKHLNPIVAVRLLQKLGFKKVKEYDAEANRTIVKVQSVGSWLQEANARQSGGASGTNAAQRIDLAKNNDLITYLKYVVEFVNANPAILNPGYTGPTMEAVGQTKLTDYAEKLKLKKRQLDRPGASSISLASGLDLLEASIKGNLLGASRKLGFVQRLPVGTHFTSPGFGIMPQTGGNLLKGFRYNSDGALIIASIFAQLNNKLAAKNKSLVEADKKAILDKVQAMQELEKDLSRQVRYLELFTDLLDMGQEYNSQIVNLAQVEEFVKSFASASQKYAKQELTLINVLRALDKISRDVKTTDATEVKTYEGQVGVSDIGLN
jgi:hypothetical protein